MGLALDESENTKDHVYQENGIDVLVNDEVQFLLQRGKPIVIDFHQSTFGSGFIIDTGHTC
ncbi:MAG: hypothetical protein N2316_01335 [Spirochaetes bacterium]|nr:hypothetical protein [Spirochaetota bacterium]